MENATKALLIAAAVLIAILLISLGVGVFNSASEQMESADLSEYQIQQFNDKFKKYENTSVSGSDVNALLDTVFNHNMAQEEAATRVAIEWGSNANGKPTGWANITTTAKPTASYKKVSTKCFLSTIKGTSPLVEETFHLTQNII